MSIIKKIFLAVLVVIVVAGCYWQTLTSQEKWLLVDGNLAKNHAKQLLYDASHHTTSKTPDELIDFHIFTTSNGAVIFINHDEEDKLTAYSPNGVPDVEGVSTKEWKHIRKLWYSATLNNG